MPVLSVGDEVRERESRSAPQRTSIAAGTVTSSVGGVARSTAWRRQQQPESSPRRRRGTNALLVGTQAQRQRRLARPQASGSVLKAQRDREDAPGAWPRRSAFAGWDLRPRASGCRGTEATSRSADSRRQFEDAERRLHDQDHSGAGATRPSRTATPRPGSRRRSPRPSAGSVAGGCSRGARGFVRIPAPLGAMGRLRPPVASLRRVSHAAQYRPPPANAHKISNCRPANSPLTCANTVRTTPVITRIFGHLGEGKLHMTSSPSAKRVVPPTTGLLPSKTSRCARSRG